MALTDFASYRAALAAAPATVWLKSPGSASSTEYMFMSTWDQTDNAGAVPTTPVTLSASTAGAIPHPPSAGWMALASCELNPQMYTSYADAPRMGLLIDRLSHQSGLSGNVTGAQTTNLPTAALTRYTDGVGVMAALHVYTGVGSTDTTVTVNYTNTADEAHSGIVNWVATPSSKSFMMVPLQAGDLGVKSVQSVALAGGTGTVGNFGVTLFKPLAFVGPQVGRVDANQILGWNSKIDTDACLELLVAPYFVSSSQQISVLSFMDT